jgi:hypothetical protein
MKKMQLNRQDAKTPREEEFLALSRFRDFPQEDSE